MPRNLLLLILSMACLGIFTNGAVPAAPDDSTTPGVQRPMTTSEKIKAKRLNVQLDVETDVASAVYAYVNRNLVSTQNEARVQGVITDDLGLRHVRIRQYHKGVPVDGTDMTVHVDRENKVYWVTGSMADRIDVDVVPRITASQAERIAIEDALSKKCTDPYCSRWGSADTGWSRLTYDLQYDVERDIHVVGTPSLIIYGREGLAYSLTVSERVKDVADWEYWIDAKTGSVVLRSNSICFSSSYPPSNYGYDTLVKGVKLHEEIVPGSGDSVVSMMGWKDTVDSHHYFIYYKGKPDSAKTAWGVFDLDSNGSPADTVDDPACRWEQSDYADWQTTDRHGISLGSNVQRVLTWMKDTLGLYSIDDGGKFIRAYSYWGNIGYGAGFLPSCTSFAFSHGYAAVQSHGDHSELDMVAHEMTHGCNFFIYGAEGPKQGPEDRAIGESYADIGAAVLEFYAQPDSSSKFPNSVNGCADWYLAEDCLLPPRRYYAMRDFRYGLRHSGYDSVAIVTASYFDDSLYFYGYGNWSIYAPSGVQSTCFYLLSQGSANPDTNQGHPISSFAGIGVNKAARVAMNSRYYLGRYPTNQDCRNAWFLAAQDLIDAGILSASAMAAVESSWVSVGVTPELRIKEVDNNIFQIGKVGNLKLSGMAKSSVPWPASGLYVKHIRTGLGMAIKNTPANETDTTVYEDTLLEQQASFLDNPGTSFSNGLVIRAPDGKVHLFLDSTGCVRARDRLREWVY
jgi:Zn-dependent metalloprotease